MKNLQLKEKHQNTVIAKTLKIKKQIDYYNSNISPKLNDLEQWMKKEYVKNHENVKKEYENLKEYILDNEELFNEILNEYNINVVSFFNSLDVEKINAENYDFSKKEERERFIKDCESNIINEIKNIDFFENLIIDISYIHKNVVTFQIEIENKRVFGTGISFDIEDETINFGTSGKFNPHQNEGMYYKYMNISLLMKHWNEILRILNEYKVLIIDNLIEK